MSYKNLDGAVVMIVQDKNWNRYLFPKDRFVPLQSYETIYTSKQWQADSFTDL